MAQIKIENVMRIPKLLILVISGRVKIQLIYENFHWTLQSWTLISRHPRKCQMCLFSVCYNAGQKLLRKTRKTASYLKPQAIENSFKRAYGDVEDNIIIYIERLKT